MTGQQSRFWTAKRWDMKDGVETYQVRYLVEAFIEPHYQRLPGLVGLHLGFIKAERAFMATQMWTTRQARDAAVAAPEYQQWWAEYQPILEKWNAMLTFNAEWEIELGQDR